ncbi:MAG: hypothetical protein MK085_13860 [Phycisphaerales bacterium]|nr:hypothetical protein [Phycisphaerales bacterium]
MDGRRGVILVACMAWALQACEDATTPPKAEVATVALDEKVKRRVLRASPLPPMPADPTNRVADLPEAAQLGQSLFFEERLSGTGTFSCATCHDPARHFADGRQLSMAISEGTRHTPSLLNVGHHRWITWDGRSDSLWAQALRPMEHPDEMGGDRVAVARLMGSDPQLRSAYEEIFGAFPLDVDALPLRARPGEDAELAEAWASLDPEVQESVMEVMANVGKALAAYQRKLESRDAPFDRFVTALRGNQSTEGLLSPQAQRGMALFFGVAECWECHAGPLFSDGEFHNIGVPPTGGGLPRDPGRFLGSRIVKSDPFNAAGPFSDAREGDWATTVRGTRIDPDTWGAFKTPSLRGVAKTPPYMHAGQFQSLEEVVRFYSTLEGAVQLDHHQEQVLSPLNLSEEQISALVAFLESLAGNRLDETLLGPYDGQERGKS